MSEFAARCVGWGSKGLCGCSGLLTANYLLLTTHCSLLSLLTTLTAHCSLLTTHYSFLITHYARLTTFMTADRTFGLDRDPDPTLPPRCRRVAALAALLFDEELPSISRS